jgi:hypothetical protein
VRALIVDVRCVLASLPEKTILAGMGVILSIVLWLFGAIVVLGGLVFLVLDALDRIESIERRAPWIPKILARRSALVALLMISTVLLIGDGYELVTKEIPEKSAPPVISIPTPLAPHLTIVQSAPPIKNQCWVYSHGYLGNPLAGLTTLHCNTTIDSPFLITIQYDQKLTKAETPMLPKVRGLARLEETVRDDSVVIGCDYPAIKPNEPWALVVYGQGTTTPAIKNVILSTKKGMAVEVIY